MKLIYSGSNHAFILLAMDGWNAAASSCTFKLAAK